MDLWGETLSDINEIEREAGELTIDQKIQLALARSMLSVSQEISALNPQNTAYRDDEDTFRNGWGLKTHRNSFSTGA